MAQLNYKHLRYFQYVAQEGHLARAAEKLNISASALSIQIRQLEERLGHALFDRVGRSLVLTEVGHIALDYADRIFNAGDDLMAVLDRRSAARPPLRIGALSTMSRNFQMQFLQPLITSDRYPIILRSGDTASLLTHLENMALDVVLTTELPRQTERPTFAAQKITEQAVGIHAHAARLSYDTLEALLRNEPLILPSESVIRSGFENLVARLDLKPTIAATVDDMAMVRLSAREGLGVAIAPAVVLADEIESGIVATAPFDLGIMEPFYAVTLPRAFPHPALADVL
ncbi:MAG: LysR family transcriptional regulator [Pseudomonadota bacterium]